MGRNLLNRSYEVLGLDQRVWISQETGGYGEAATGGLLPQAAGAKEHINAKIGFNIPREDSAARSGRSVAVRLSGKKEVEWEWESYIIPGTPDNLGNPTLPPLHELIVSCFGAVDLSDPTKVVYKLSRLNDKTFRMLEETSHYSRLALGCVTDEMTFSFPGDSKAMFKASGFGQDVFAGGQTTLAQALTGIAQFASLVKQDLTFDADAAGSPGNDISIDYTTGGTAGSEVVTVVGSAISVQIEDGVSTATQVKAAIDGFPAAAALVNVTISGVGGNAQSATGAAQYLSGGLGANQLKVAAGKGQLFEVDAYLDTISATDGNTTSNSAKKIVAIGTGQNADVITVDSALAAAIVGEIVIGHAPATYSPISSETALLGLKGSISFVGFTGSGCEVIMGEVSIKNNFTKKDFIYGTSKTCGYIPDKRRNVSVKVDLLLNQDNFLVYMRNKQFIAENVTIKLEPQDIPSPSYQTTVGRTFEFNFPKVEFNIPALEQPADGYVKLSLEGTAMATDLNNVDNEATLTIK